MAKSRTKTTNLAERLRGARRTASGVRQRSVATRQAKSEARREAILAAALDEFSTSGFEATRLDDVARRAGIAKGTIYLYFRDKESLFQELIRSMLTPLVGSIEAMGAVDLPMRVIAEHMVELFVREVYETRRKDVIRLMIAEGRRFPHSSPNSTTARCSRASSPRCARFCAAPPRAAKCRRRWWISRKSLPRRAWSRSSGAGCSNVSSRSTCAR